MVVKNLKLFFTILFFGSILIACGDSDSESASKSAAPMEEKAMTSSDDAGSSAMANMERAEGVVYQDEIYKNWPYQ
jgi:hypothetical protein